MLERSSGGITELGRKWTLVKSRGMREKNDGLSEMRSNDLNTISKEFKAGPCLVMLVVFAMQ